MSDVESFIYDQDDPQKEVMLFLHNLLVTDYNLTPKIRYQIPFYYRKSWICYINPTKAGAIEFSFPRGNELSNFQGLLLSKGRKQVMSTEFKNITEVPGKILNEIIQEAIILDETVPYASKRKK